MTDDDEMPAGGHESSPQKDDQKVGYGKPPIHSRFKPGNPGRGKGSKKKRDFTLSELINEAMRRRRKVRWGDRVVSMQVAEIFIERLITLATSGSPSEMTKVLTMIARHAPSLLAAPEFEARITYHRAPGSKVELPPAHLWTAPKEPKQ